VSLLVAEPRALVGDPLVVLGACALLGSWAPSAPLPCLLLAALWLGYWARGKRWMLACVLAFVVCGVRAEGARGRYRQAWSESAEQFAGLHRCAVRGVVVSTPTARRSLESAQAFDEHFVLRVKGGACGDLALSAGTLLRLSLGSSRPLSVAAAQPARSPALGRRDELDLIADLGPLRLFRNAALTDPFDAAARQGAVLGGRVLSSELVRSGTGWGAWIDRARSKVRARILGTYAPSATALGRALVLGESDLDEADGRAFRKSGLMHLLAVSGTHLVIAVVALASGLRALLVRIGPLARRFDVSRLSGALGALLSALYADFAGGSGSAWRAAYMLILVLGGRSLGLCVGGAPALGASLLVGLALDPLVGSDVSFLLSALATAGLIGIGQPLGARLDWGPFARFPLKPVITSLVATWSATVACAPVLALMDGRMTFAALLANVVAGPLGEVLALPACLLHAVASPWPAVERGLALVGSGALLLVRAIALFSADQEAMAFVIARPDPWQCASTAALFVAGPSVVRSLLVLGVRRSVCVCVLVVPIAAAMVVDRSPTLGKMGLPMTVARPRLLGITALDVDQGDALVVDFPDGKLGLVDGGGFATGVPDTGERVVLPYLRARGRRDVDLMILSHAHPDHLLGLVSVAEALPVRELWLPPSGRSGPDVERLVRAVRRVGGRVREADELCPAHAKSEVTTFGGAQLAVLVPCDAHSAWADLGENDRSLVVHVRFGSRSALLTGDIEHEGERRLVGAGHSLGADLLKLAHHGSDTSSGAELLAAVRPSLGLISCGVRNRFGHPRRSVLERLQASGVRTLRTDRQGSLTWLTDGEHMWLRAFPGMDRRGSKRKTRPPTPPAVRARG